MFLALAVLLTACSKQPAEPGLVVHDAGGGGMPAVEHRRPRRIAQRILAIRPIEPHADLRQAVDVRRLHLRMPVTAEVAIAEIVGENDDNVRRTRLRMRQQRERT